MTVTRSLVFIANQIISEPKEEFNILESVLLLNKSIETISNRKKPCVSLCPVETLESFKSKSISRNKALVLDMFSFCNSSSSG